MRRYRDSIRVNTISAITKTVKENVYHEKIKNDQLFFFGVQFDSEGEPILGCGKCDPKHTNKPDSIQCSSTSHLNLMMTSVELMRSVENEGIARARFN